MSQRHRKSEASFEMPILKSIGICNIEGTNNWVSYILTTKGKDVLKLEISEPDVKAIAEESAKINFADIFIDGRASA